eukprot:gene11136-biopygen21371
MDTTGIEGVVMDHFWPVPSWTCMDRHGWHGWHGWWCDAGASPCHGGWRQQKQAFVAVSCLHVQGWPPLFDALDS